VLDPRDTTPNRPTGNDILPFHSRLIVAPRLDAESTLTSSLIQRVSGSLVYVYESSRFADAAGLAVIPAQASLDAEAAAAGLDDHLTARLRVANVLGAPRFDVVGFPLPGRSAFFSMEATW
jgi:vitamin B12 transporter